MNTRRQPRPPRRQRGQGTIEFQITAAFILIPLLMFVLQIGLLVIGKNTLNVATLNAARAGAASGGSHDAMKDALALGLAPLYASDAKAMTGVGMADINAANYAPVMAAALGKAKAANLLWTRITVRNPTADAFQDFGVTRAGNTVIPVTNVLDNAAVGPRSGQTRADALLLKIEVRYCHKMVIPIIDKMIASVLNSPLSGASAEDRLCYVDDRVPLVSQAVVRMTVPPSRQALLK